MLDWIATPFLTIGMASLWLAGLVNGRGYVVMEISDDVDGNYNDE